MTDTTNPASAAAQTGPGRHHQRLASEVPGLHPPATTDQAQNLIRRSGVRPSLRVVTPAPTPPQPRIDVRISASDGREPHCRSRPFHLTHDDYGELIAIVARMEAMR